MSNQSGKQGCNFDKFPNSEYVPQLAKDIYLGNDFSLSDDDEVLALLDSLNSESIDSRRFYFKVLILSSKKADGYYSEGLGEAVKDYIEFETQEFTRHFDDKNCFTRRDMELLSDLILYEFKILSEDSSKTSLIEEYSKSLRDNCRDCSPTQMKTIEKFTEMLKNKYEAH